MRRLPVVTNLGIEDVCALPFSKQKRTATVRDNALFNVRSVFVTFNVLQKVMPATPPYYTGSGSRDHPPTHTAHTSDPLSHRSTPRPCPHRSLHGPIQIFCRRRQWQTPAALL